MSDEPGSVLNRLFSWITTPGQASATGAGMFLLGGGDAAFDILPHADFLGSSAIGAVGGLSLILGAQSIGAVKARARERRRTDSERRLRDSVESLIQLLAEEGYRRLAYELADTYRMYLHDVVSETELRDWMEASRDVLRTGRPPRFTP